MDPMKPTVTVLGVEFDFNDLAEVWLDPDIRESVHQDLSPCSPQAFVDEYCKRHLIAFGEVFDPREDWQD